MKRTLGKISVPKKFVFFISFLSTKACFSCAHEAI